MHCELKSRKKTTLMDNLSSNDVPKHNLDNFINIIRLLIILHAISKFNSNTRLPLRGSIENCYYKKNLWMWHSFLAQCHASQKGSHVHMQLLFSDHVSIQWRREDKQIRMSWMLQLEANLEQTLEKYPQQTFSHPEQLPPKTSCQPEWLHEHDDEGSIHFTSLVH